MSRGFLCALTALALTSCAREEEMRARLTYNRCGLDIEACSPAFGQAKSELRFNNHLDKPRELEMVVYAQKFVSLGAKPKVVKQEISMNLYPTSRDSIGFDGDEVVRFDVVAIDGVKQFDSDK